MNNLRSLVYERLPSQVRPCALFQALYHSLGAPRLLCVIPALVPSLRPVAVSSRYLTLCECHIWLTWRRSVVLFAHLSLVVALNCAQYRFSVASAPLLDSSTAFIDRGSAACSSLDAALADHGILQGSCSS